MCVCRGRRWADGSVLVLEFRQWRDHVLQGGTLGGDDVDKRNWLGVCCVFGGLLGRKKKRVGAHSGKSLWESQSNNIKE
jgi:hypothetical protein